MLSTLKLHFSKMVTQFINNFSCKFYFFVLKNFIIVERRNNLISMDIKKSIFRLLYSWCERLNSDGKM